MRKERVSHVPVAPALARAATMKQLNGGSRAHETDEPRCHDDPRVDMERNHVADDIVGMRHGVSRDLVSRA